MTVFATIAFAAFLLENDDFVSLHQRGCNLAYYFCSFNGGSADFHVTVGVSEENAVENNLFAFFDSFAEIVNIQELAGFSLELLSLDFYDSVHL